MSPVPRAADRSSAAPEGEDAPRLFGLMAEFEDPATVVAAACRVRDGGYRRWDVHTPFPVHGLDEAMGLRGGLLPVLVFGGGVAGAAIALHLQWWTNAVDYPLLISGKPLFSVPANIPIVFELAVLAAAFTAFFGMLALARLPRFRHPTMTSARFRRVTADRFFIVIEAADPRFDPDATRDLLESLGSTAVEELVD